MPTLADLKLQVQDLLDRYNTVKLRFENPDSMNTTIQSVKGQTKTLNQQAEQYNREFEEEQAKFAALGGKTRKQTLQEFVLLFFFVSYLLFIVAMATYSSVTEGSSAAAKMIGIGILGLGLLSGFIIRFG